MEYITKHAIEFVSLIVGIASLIVAYFALVVPVRQYLGQRELEERDKRFKNYHKLIKNLVASESAYIDRQIAVIFELRNYPEYFNVTRRILDGLRQNWIHSSIDARRVIVEIDLTLDFISTQ